MPKFRAPTLTFLMLFLGFYNCFFSQKNVFSDKSSFVTTYIKTDFTKSVETICFCSIRALQTTRRPEIKLLASENEGATSRFYKKYFRQIKLFQKIKK